MLNSLKDNSQKALLLNFENGWAKRKESFILFQNPAMSLDSNKVKLRCRGLDAIRALENFLAEGYFAVGYIGYEFFKFIERDFTPNPAKGRAIFPDMYFLLFKEEDMITGKINELELKNENAKTCPEPSPNMTKTRYMRMVDRARQYIAKGDIYQVNLSQLFEVRFNVEPFSFLTKLYHVQPVPFACCVDFGQFQLISGSMELFLRKTGRRLVTRPIKGTRKRGVDKTTDETLRKELATSEKERAENLMIVDLMRNDLGRICEYKSVKVNKLFEIEPYPTLYQMVSEVEGKLRDGTAVGDIIRSTFPPGSVTGAPKRRAIELIDELEPHLRGPYCGVIGMFSPDGDFTLSVAIRILAVKQGKGNFWVGGGIMWDSQPELEYEETLIKARAIVKALA